MRLKPKKNLVGKTFLFVDGTNLYAGQYELLGPDKYLVFSLFIKEIESKTGISFDKIYFYASYSPRSKNPTKREKLYLKNEALFNIKKFHDKKNIYLICLENKIMYKGAFYFGTYIVSLRKVGQKFHNKQKIKILKIDESEVVRLLPH